jgi:hypothetical protein
MPSLFALPDPVRQLPQGPQDPAPQDPAPQDLGPQDLGFLPLPSYRVANGSRSRILREVRLSDGPYRPRIARGDWCRRQLSGDAADCTVQLSLAGMIRGLKANTVK